MDHDEEQVLIRHARKCVEQSELTPKPRREVKSIPDAAVLTALASATGKLFKIRLV